MAHGRAPGGQFAALTTGLAGLLAAAALLVAAGASVKLDGRARLGSLVSNVSDSSANLHFGLAVGDNFSRSFGTELGFLRTSGEIGGQNGDLGAITLSARFSF